MTSHEVKACFVFASQACLRAAHVSMAPHPRDRLNAKDTDMEQTLLLYYVTTKVLVKCCINICIISYILMKRVRMKSFDSGQKYKCYANYMVLSS